MKNFQTVAIPHKDIIEGNFTLDVYAADLWETFNQRGPNEYKDSSLFFQKTYITEGLNSLIESVKKRIDGKPSDPVIEIQTPFGGGKTHSLIALLHKAKEWKVNVSVLVGTNISSKDTLWAIMEKQLKGKNEILTTLASPGKEKLKEILKPLSPIVILVDELLEYIVKASAEKVGDSNLASQTLAFMQELTETVSSLDRSCLVATLPASLLEYYDENGERYLEQLQKIFGRIEKVETPVKDSEISKVIRRRLFSNVKEDEIIKIANEYIEYARKENILPVGIDPIQYRNRFVDSYPFLPEVIDVLYHRWGSLQSFQRTRGVLRFLALVIHSLLKKNLSYISISDIPLDNPDIKGELVKHIGTEYNSIIAQDITGEDSGSKKVDNNLPDSYTGLNLGTRTSTTIFMYSFSGGQEKGATLNEIKRMSTTINNPTSLIIEILDQLKGKLFYLQNINDKFLFNNQPNINRILLTKMENIQNNEIIETEKEFLKQLLSRNSKYFNIYIWEENPNNIIDSEDLKLIILRQENPQIIKNIINTKGSTTRVNCNTLIFLFPNDRENNSLPFLIKKYLAYLLIKNDRLIKINQQQIEDMEKDFERLKKDIYEQMRKIYSNIAIPNKDEYKKDYTGIPTYGDNRTIDEYIYDYLKSKGEILDKLSPFIIHQKYIENKNFIETKNLYLSFYRTPGNPRILSKNVLENTIKEGVEKGFFGLGVLDDNNINVKYYKETPNISFSENEIIIESKICEKMVQEKEIKTNKIENIQLVEKPYPSDETLTQGHENIRNNDNLSSINLSFKIPVGKVSDIAKILNFLVSKFESINIKINAENGSISKYEYENKIKESLNQMGIEFDEK